MSREWKPGDVGVFTIGGDTSVVAIRDEDGDWSGVNERGGLYTQRKWDDAHNGRPLVVIDPEDREQLERIHREQERGIQSIREANPHIVGVSLIDALQIGLRRMNDSEFTPKPEEPTGLGAVVEDEEQRLFVNVGTAKARWRHGSSAYYWSEFRAVRILSEGVQP